MPSFRSNRSERHTSASLSPSSSRVGSTIDAAWSGYAIPGLRSSKRFVHGAPMFSGDPLLFELRVGLAGVRSRCTTYAYNGDGLRMTKGTTQYSWDTQSKLPLMLVEGNDAYLHGPDGWPLAKITGTTITYLAHDEQGSTRLITDDAGTSSAPPTTIRGESSSQPPEPPSLLATKHNYATPKPGSSTSERATTTRTPKHSSQATLSTAAAATPTTTSAPTPSTAGISTAPSAGRASVGVRVMH
jgi:hypothetical protein